MTSDRHDECHPCARLTGARTGSRVARVAPPEFYVGYLDETPPGISRFARRAVIGLLLLAATLGAGLALLLERFDEGVFEYGTVRDYEGELLVDPHPRLLTEGGPAEGYLLVGVGKHGLDVNEEPSLPWLAALSRRLQLSGTLIQNPEAAMLEVHSLKLPEGRTSEELPTEPDSLDDPGTGGSPPDSQSDDSAAAATPADAQVGSAYIRVHTVVGEIVDTKCYLGAMKPGRGKPHRDCASLCIRGGIPAALLVRTENGERRLVHLVNLAGQPLGQELLEWVGQPVEVTGQLRRHDDRLILRTLIFDRATAAASIRPYPARPPPTGSGP